MPYGGRLAEQLEAPGTSVDRRLEALLAVTDVALAYLDLDDGPRVAEVEQGLGLLRGARHLGLGGLGSGDGLGFRLGLGLHLSIDLTLRIGFLPVVSSITRSRISSARPSRPMTAVIM